MANASILCGYLKKKGQKGVVKSFKRRWFQYDPLQLSLLYYKSEKDHRPLGKIDLKQVASCDERPDFPFGFAICIPNRTYLLAAGDAETTKKWVKFFQGVIDRLAGESSDQSPLPEKYRVALLDIVSHIRKDQGAGARQQIPEDSHVLPLFVGPGQAHGVQTLWLRFLGGHPLKLDEFPLPTTAAFLRLLLRKLPKPLLFAPQQELLHIGANRPSSKAKELKLVLVSLSPATFSVCTQLFAMLHDCYFRANDTPIALPVKGDRQKPRPATPSSELATVFATLLFPTPRYESTRAKFLQTEQTTKKPAGLDMDGYLSNLTAKICLVEELICNYDTYFPPAPAGS